MNAYTRIICAITTFGGGMKIIFEKLWFVYNSCIMHIKDQVERVEKQKKNKIRTIWKGEEKIINYLFYVTPA